jgi:hypothetical protein
MHVSVADLEEDGELRNALRAMIGASGRTHRVPS